MADQFITVATFNRTFEAQMAKNLLENEGIDAIMGGAFASDMLFGSLAVGDQIVLQVRADDAQRAAGILAVAAAEARLDDDWEEQTESGVWICSLCGEPISNRLSICYSCQTPKDSIRTASPRESDAIQTDLTPTPSSEDITDKPTQKIVIHETPSVPVRTKDDDNEEPAMTRGDDLARKAFLASIFAAVMPVLLPVAWVMLVRAAWQSDDTTAKGNRYFYAVLLLNLFAVGLICFLCAGWRK